MKMVFSILRSKGGRRHSEQRPLMSPRTTPRNAQQPQRRDADFDSPNDDEDNEESEEQEEDEDEDEEAGLTPLLPIFEAAQLGRSSCHVCQTSLIFLAAQCRCPSCIQPDACYPSAGDPEMRDNLVVGSTPVTTSFSVPCQAHTAANLGLPLQQSDIICTGCQLLAVQ